MFLLIQPHPSLPSFHHEALRQSHSHQRRNCGRAQRHQQGDNTVQTNNEWLCANRPLLDVRHAARSRRSSISHPFRMSLLSSLCVFQSSVRTFAAFADFNWKDPLNLDSKLTDEERMVRDTAHTYAQTKLMPRITQANRSDNNARKRRHAQQIHVDCICMNAAVRLFSRAPAEDRADACFVPHFSSLCCVVLCCVIVPQRWSLRQGHHARDG